MNTIALTSNHWMIIAGAGLILLGLLVRRRTSRYDLKDAVLDSAWQTARGRRSAENPTAIEKKLKEISSEASATGKATRAAGTVIGHLYAQIMGIIALVSLLAGAALVAAGVWWK